MAYRQSPWQGVLQKMQPGPSSQFANIHPEPAQPMSPYANITPKPAQPMSPYSGITPKPAQPMGQQPQGPGQQAQGQQGQQVRQQVMAPLQRFAALFGGGPGLGGYYGKAFPVGKGQQAFQDILRQMMMEMFVSNGIAD